MKWQNLTPRIVRAFISTNLLLVMLSHSAPAQTSPPANPILKKCWTFPNGSGVIRLSASDNAKALVFIEEVGKVGALDPSDGKQLWLSDFGGKVASNIAVNKTIVVFATISEGVTPDKPGSAALRAISIETGITVWTAALPYSDKFYLELDEKYVYSVASSGKIAAFDKIDGVAAWQADLAGPVTAAPAFSKDSIAIGLETGEVVSLATGNGERSQTIKLAAPAVSVAIGPGTIFSGDKKGSLISSGLAQNNSAWKFKSGAQISSITITNEGLLVSSYDNFLYLIGIDKGNVLWKRRLSGRLLDKPEIFESTAALTVLGEPGALLIELKSGRVTGKTTPSGDDDPIELALIGSTVVLADESGIHAFSAGGCVAK